VEEKLKKTTTEKAPVAGPSVGSGTGGGSGPPFPNANALLSSLGRRGDFPGLEQLLSQATRSGEAASSLPAYGAGEGSGAAAAAGVLTALDVDEEGQEEPTKPDDFDYFTEDEDEGGEDYNE
jgi:26S proteasome regulatory subunit N2